MYEEESVGGLLSPKDQFDLKIPMNNRQPVGILRVQNVDVMDGSRCIQLNGQNTRVQLPEIKDIDLNSTVSSLTGATPDFAPLRMKTDHINASATHQRKSVPVMNVLGSRIRLDGSCCGITAHTEDTDEVNSIVTSDNESQRKAAHRADHWALCGDPGPEKAKDIVKAPMSSPVDRRPQVFLRAREDTSLFDTLADEVEDAETIVAPAEDAATFESGTSTKRSKTSRASILGLTRSRSFKKARSFLKGKRKRKIR
jgi:hypothetical protein